MGPSRGAVGARGAGQPARAAARTVGILALQGGFEAHARIVRSLGAAPLEVRVPAQLGACSALIIPGGESTVMSLAIDRRGPGEKIP
ncbi:MAG: hypothetical protein ACR2OB_05770, partial [Solirubrobacteraceae bacterium]